ncbi:MAG: hypothetical protein KDJ65_40640, partial [Anaerolineae bacterium]|nr:hypothetical protein [Anaerolineae bacterium]
MRKQVELMMISVVLMGLLAGCLATDLTDTPDSPESTAAPTEEILLTAESPSTAAPTEETVLATESPSSEASTEVNFLTADGISLSGHYYPISNSEAEARTLLLLHGAYEDSHRWDFFKAIAQDKGYAIFTMDF